MLTAIWIYSIAVAVSIYVIGTAGQQWRSNP